MTLVQHDTLFQGRVKLAQPKRGEGYRVNVDALILAAFAARGLGARRVARAAFDLGAGVGAVGLSLLHEGAAEHVTMVEIDSSLAALANMNAELNAWRDRIHVLCADVANVAALPAGAADLVVFNPPYVEPGRGRVPLEHHARAKQGALVSFVDAARRLAGRRARICLIYPALEATTLLTLLRARGLEPKRLQSVHSCASENARVVLVECCAGRPGGLVMEPPLIEVAS